MNAKAFALIACVCFIGSQASASVIATFGASPNPINPGDQSTIDLQLNLLSDYYCASTSCNGDYGAYFFGGIATIYNGIGGSQTFNIGSGGTSRDFQFQSTYADAGTWHPSFTLTASYLENYKLWQYQYTDYFSCGTFGTDTCWRPVYGWTQYSTTPTNSFSGSADLTVTPLPAGLPLFAAGLGALGLLGWHRKRKAAALAA